MSKQDDFNWPYKRVKKRRKFTTELKHQKKPKGKENSTEIGSACSLRHPVKLSNILGLPPKIKLLSILAKNS